jgi:hypothetical protein
VDASAAPVSAPDRSISTGLFTSITRNEFFAALYVLGCANGLLGRVIQSVQFSDWEGAITGIDINVIILMAAFAGIFVVMFLSCFAGMYMPINRHI